MKKKICNVINFVLLSMMLVSCDCCKETTTIDIGGGGDFFIVNMATNDTLKVKGSLSIFPVYETIEARNRNVIKIMFEPKEKYKNYTFETAYTFPNDKVVENQPQYEYVIGDSLEGSYNIHLSALSSGDSHGDTWKITAGGTFTLKVIQ